MPMEGLKFNVGYGPLMGYEILHVGSDPRLHEGKGPRRVALETAKL